VEYAVALNLVVIPMEGMSQTLFWQYRESMPALWRLYNQSLRFGRFYSSATSAFQSFCDFLHGSSTELDHNLAFPAQRGCLSGKARNLFAILHEKGYATLGIQHGEAMPGYLRDNCLGAWPDECGEFRWRGNYDGFRRETFDFIEKAAAAGKPFAVYYSDKASAVSDDCEEKRKSPLFHQRVEKGFSLLDDSARAMLDKLSERSLLANTVVACYGPYGTDFWKHGVSAGRTHAIEPYADLCWTPFFIYFNNNHAELIQDIAAGIDIKSTLLNGVLFPGDDFKEPVTGMSGINLFAMGRAIAFSQNLFAMERENEGTARRLMKSYAATDGDQRLIVSSDGGIPGDGGMELFYDMRDPGNTRNLLDFFKLNDGGAITAFGHPDIIHPHFHQSFKPNLLQSVIDAYNKMRAILRALIKKKEETAFRHCPRPSDCKFFRETTFNYKRRRR
jgi:arylsulfatase A-like enzyme